MISNMWTTAGLVLVFSVTALANDCHTSNGGSGMSCGPRNHRCLSGKASCDVTTGVCECFRPKYGYGDGRMNCYRKNTFRTEIYNDPTIKTFNNNTMALPIPCRYLWSHTVSFLKDKQRKRVGFCEAQIHAFHQKDKGKFYVAGFDIAINVTYDNGTNIRASIRKYGKASNGNYQHCVNATDNQYLPQGPWGNDDVKYYDPDTNLLIKCQYDDNNNLAFLDIKKCGLRLQLRPYDCDARLQQNQVPHAAFEVNCAFHPAFMQQDKVVGISPSTDHQGGPTIDGYLVDGLNREETTIYRALTSGADQNSPFGTDECERASDVMATCSPSELDKAFEECLWILKSPRFIRCYDPTKSGDKIMGLFNECFEVYCGNRDCNLLIQKITDTGCHGIIPPYPAVLDFVSGLKCPPF